VVGGGGGPGPGGKRALVTGPRGEEGAKGVPRGCWCESFVIGQGLLSCARCSNKSKALTATKPFPLPFFFIPNFSTEVAGC
jgi:hypothetical protein